MTERLYFSDSYLRSFHARVTESQIRDGQPAVALSQSAFYPEGGGQPADHGTLNGVAVIDVQSDNAGEVWHLLAQPLSATAVVAEIDWPRRFDHMQQHHGQHLLSAAFEQLYGMKTISFHLGAAVVTIDIDTPTLSAEQAAAAEDLANQVIWENRPVLARFVTSAELADIPLRKPPTVSGPIRVVSVPEFDHSACGGTHPRTTGGVGMLSIRRWERRGAATRVEFLCGARALGDLRAKHALLSRLTAALSVGADEIEVAVGRVREAEERARKGMEEARGQLLTYEAHDLAARAVSIGGAPVVQLLSEPRGIEELRSLARLVAEQGCVAVIGMAADKGHLIVARGPQLKADSGAVLRAALAPLGGKGGGRPELAQGGLADPALVAEAIRLAIAAIAAGPA